MHSWDCLCVVQLLASMRRGLYVLSIVTRSPVEFEPEYKFPYVQDLPDGNYHALKKKGQKAKGKAHKEFMAALLCVQTRCAVIEPCNPQPFADATVSSGLWVVANSRHNSRTAV